jgi:imidazolonepropionase-like amidohydrolase
MARAGISLQAIFEAATLNNARLLKLDRHYGTVSMGKVANLLLLNKNPLLSSDAWGQIEQVILHGKVFERAQFAAHAVSAMRED